MAIVVQSVRGSRIVVAVGSFLSPATFTTFLIAQSGAYITTRSGALFVMAVT